MRPCVVCLCWASARPVPTATARAFTLCCILRGMSPLTRLALRTVTRLNAEDLTAAELDEWAPALQDAAERLQDQRHDA